MNKIINWFNNNIELITQLFITICASGIYGVIENQFINTTTGNFATIPNTHIAWYHCWFVSLMILTSFSLAINQVQWLIGHKKKFILFICLGCSFLALMVEDWSWYITKHFYGIGGVPNSIGGWIGKNDWNCSLLLSNYPINFFGITYIPEIYILDVIICGFLFYLANYYVNNGYNNNLLKGV